MLFALNNVDGKVNAKKKSINSIFNELQQK